jgi:hypothetical protein
LASFDFEKHENQPSLRMRARIVKKETNDDCRYTIFTSYN